MKKIGLILSLVVLFWTGALFGAVNFMNGVSVTTSSTILGKTPNSAVMGQTLATGGGGYQFTENFEGSTPDSLGRVGYDNGSWGGYEDSGTNNVPHYNTSPAPLQGAYSFRSGDGYFASINHDFVTSTSLVHLFFYINTPNFGSGEPLVWFRTTGAVRVASVRFDAGNTLGIQTEGGGSWVTTGALSINTKYYVWVDYNSSTHTIDIYVSATSTKPGSPSATSSGGTDASATEFVLFSGQASRGIIDHVISDATQPIGNNP